MKALNLLAVLVLAPCATHAWSANTAVQTAEKAVHADKEALDAAELAANLPETFPPPKHDHEAKSGNKPATPSATPAPQLTPEERLKHRIEHVEKEIAKVAKLLAETNLPAAVSSAGQTLSTDLNKLKADLASETK